MEKLLYQAAPSGLVELFLTAAGVYFLLVASTPLFCNMRGAFEELVALVFTWWSQLGGIRLGSRLGFIKQRLDEIDLSEALPDAFPPRNLRNNDLFGIDSHRSELSEPLRRANAWAAALEYHLQDLDARRLPKNVVLTTYGFACVEGKVRLSVIHYLRPLAAFQAVMAYAHRSIGLLDWTFPVIIRPWLASFHGGTQTHGKATAGETQSIDGNCWVRFDNGSGNRRPGILTARHVIRPKKACDMVGRTIRMDVHRSVRRGRLGGSSPIMDAAVVEVESGEWHGKAIASHSECVGYKPVRFLTGHGTLDAYVTEISGPGGTIFGQKGEEPLSARYLFMNRYLDYGDSGCLILDLEFARHGITPIYMIYIGKTNLAYGGHQGIGLLLEQPRKVWDLEFYVNDTEAEE